MNAFTVWFETGLLHILDISAYDHLMFVSLVALSYSLSDWKKLLLLVTAFTFGHSLTLAMSVIQNLQLPVALIEAGIALSILIAGIFVLLNMRSRSNTGGGTVYFITLLFGLLHGLGFSFLLRSLLGNEQSIFLPLLYFNLGIEAGQLIILALVLLISLLLSRLNTSYFRIFKITLVCLITLIALKICAERFVQLFS